MSKCFYNMNSIMKRFFQGFFRNRSCTSYCKDDIQFQLLISFIFDHVRPFFSKLSLNIPLRLPTFSLEHKVVFNSAPDCLPFAHWSTQFSSIFSLIVSLGGGLLCASTTLIASLAISSIPRPVTAEHSKQFMAPMFPASARPWRRDQDDIMTSTKNCSIARDFFLNISIMINNIFPN